MLLPASLLQIRRKAMRIPVLVQTARLAVTQLIVRTAQAAPSHQIVTVTEARPIPEPSIEQERRLTPEPSIEAELSIETLTIPVIRSVRAMVQVGPNRRGLFPATATGVVVTAPVTTEIAKMAHLAAV